MRCARFILLVVLIAVLVTLANAAPAAPKVAAGRLRLVPRGDAPFSVAGLHDYFGTLELEAASDGLVVADRLSLEAYLLGLNEVPFDWPAQALRAQAIAARTYALWTLGRDPAGAAATYDFDICASVDCQVFTGADVAHIAGGRRWIDAVRATRGEVVLYEGEPILARYHSTSGGRTLDNPEAFAGESAYPYLTSVASTTEQGSPLYRWRVTFTLRDLEAILNAARWRAKGGLKEVRTVPAGNHLVDPRVVLRSARGRIVRRAQELREAVGRLAPEMFPLRYPSLAATSSGRLPETLPSNRLSIRTMNDTVVVDGRGWGHGVGMSQWGAHGLAAAGAAAEEILAHYYTGARVANLGAQGAIEVGVLTGGSSVRVRGAFDILDVTGDVVVGNALGTWEFSPTESGSIAINSPRGLQRPLAVEVVDAPQRVRSGSRAGITVSLSRPARVRAFSLGRSGPAEVVRDAGTDSVPWRAPEDPGRYVVAVEARAGPAGSKRDSVTILVVAGSQVGPPLIPPEDEGSSRLLIALLAIALTALGASAFAGTMRR